MIESKIETKHIITDLSVTEKICLYNALYEDLAAKGIEGDTELAHVNKAEMVVLRDMGGSGTINPDTGLIQFVGGSPPPPPPSGNQTVSQTSEFPTELKPFISDVLGKAQAIQEQRETEGYVPFEGPQVASFTPEQEQAFTGIQGLVGQGQGYFDPSTALAKSSAVAPTSEAVQAAMSPYTQNVVDIQQREALRQADVAQQQLGAQAVRAGGYGGSRMAILEAEQNRNTQQLLGDIQARGQAAAFEDAQTRLAQQSGRELAASGQLMNLGGVAPQQSLKELTAIEAIGAQKQAQSQQGLNIAKQQFQEEQLFPEQTLQQYQSVIRGFPLQANTYQQSQTTTPAPSFLQQAAGLGGLGLGVAGAFGGFGKAQGGLVRRMSGGQVDQTNGLGSIVVKKKVGGSFKQAMNEAAAQSAIESNYNKELFQKVLNNEITPTEYSRLVRKYKDSAMAEMPEETDIDPEFLASRTIPKGRGTAMSPVEARIAAQERRMGLSMADQPIKPSLSTEEVASRMGQSGNLDKREKSIIDSANLRNELIAGQGGADQPITPSLETDEKARRMLRQRQLEGTSTDLLNRAIIRQEAEAGSGASDIGMADPFPSDYKISSKETEAEARRMARERQLRSLLPTKKKAEAPQSIEKSMVDPASPLAMLNSAMSDPKFAAATTMGISKEAQALKDLDPASPEAMLRDAFNNPRFVEEERKNKLREELIAGQGGADQPNSTGSIPESATASSAKAPEATAKAPEATAKAPAVATTAPDTSLDDRIREQGVDDAPYPEGYNAQFADKLDKATTDSKYSTSRLPDVMKETREELFKAQQKRATEKGAELEKRRTGLDNDRWLALANLGTSILAQPGGQTFLQALGKGAKDSNIIGTLSKLNREDADLASKIKDVPVELLVSKFKLKKDEAQYVKDSTNFEFKIAELETAKLTATNKAQKDKFDRILKGLKFKNETLSLQFKLRGGQSTLSKGEFENVSNFMDSKTEQLKELIPDKNTGWYNFWSSEIDPKKKKEAEASFADYVRRNKGRDLEENFNMFIKRYK